MAFSTPSAAPHDASSPISTSLDALVSHLVASKRSLSSIEHVLRANEIVTATRKHLEESVITSARTSFLHAGIGTQLSTLERVHAHSKAVEIEGADEYEMVMSNVHEADQRLRRTLEYLRSTSVEGCLGSHSDQRKSLLDFVDEGGVDTLLATVQQSADAAKRAHAELVETNQAFQADLSHIEGVLTDPKLSPRQYLIDEDDRSGMVEDAAVSPLPGFLQTMEDSAKDMADNLESLVKHFDLCVTAIKHTEGGDDAAQRLTDDLLAGVDVEVDVVKSPPEPMSDQERQEMLEVLAKDSDQVEDVVMEIREHILEMEAQNDSVETYIDQLNQAYTSTITAFRLLEGVENRLHAFVAQSQVFVMRWDDEKAKISEQMQELESLGGFYSGYLSAYDNLLVEIGRRQFMEQQMEKVVHEAMRKLENLYEEDNTKREAFKNSYGDFLPVDIWPGLINPPLQFETKPITGIERVPDVSKSVIQRAIRRVEGKSTN
ncbi:MAG: hypothetical protein Q9220_003660 [cf. Caloplaca sp. 1 TL-2023]